VSFIVVIGCAPKPYRSDTSWPLQKLIISAGIGDEFFKQELMYGDANEFGVVFNGDASMFTLTVVSLNDKTLSLQYREFFKPTGRGGGFTIGDRWMIRDKFSQRFDYDLSSNVVKFRSYEFQVLEVKDGRISYIRIL
jgi:hypothetical protein